MNHTAAIVQQGHVETISEYVICEALIFVFRLYYEYHLCFDF